MFKLSVSNIAWSAIEDNKVYVKAQELGFLGIEIAPTRIFPNDPYAHSAKARAWSEKLKNEYGLSVSSIQSIWYGRTEKIFTSEIERNALIDYTKRAIEFAEVLESNNIVFGCPKNRYIPENLDEQIAVPFFKELGEYALAHNTVIALEANTPIYNTNFINTTKDAIEFVGRVDSDGFMLNLDTGSMIENGEGVLLLKGYTHLIHHVHISERELKPIQKRGLHKELKDLLKKIDYQGFISIEVRRQDNLINLFDMMEYVADVFK